MVRKIKIEAVIEVGDDVHVDDALLKRTINSLGDVQSCEVDNNFDENAPTEKPPVTSTADKSVSEIDHFINDANKIYFGTLSIDERKFVAASILHSASIAKIKDDSGYKTKLNKTFLEKFDLDPNYTEQLLNQDKDESVLGTLKDKFLEGDLIQMYTYLWVEARDRPQHQAQAHQVSEIVNVVSPRDLALSILALFKYVSNFANRVDVPSC